MKSRMLLLFALIALSLVACSSIDDRSSGGDMEFTGWGHCFPSYDEGAECGTFYVPLDYADQSGDKIQIYSYRYLGSADTKKGQVWLLEGGPGYSGAVLQGMLKQYAAAFPEYDFYSLDHRGVGLSTRLGCPQEDLMSDIDPELMADCVDYISAEWGDLYSFSTTYAAEDLYRLVQSQRFDGKVFIYGVSYGTYWLQRFLQLYPDAVDGIILDSICSPGDCYLDRYDGWFNMVGQQFMDRCADDTACNSRMTEYGADPWSVLEATVDDAGTGDLCDAFATLIDRNELRYTLAMMSATWGLRNLVPPLLYRMNRCSEDDVEAITPFLEAFTDDSGGALRTDNLTSAYMLAQNINLSELYSGLTWDEVGDLIESYSVTPEVSMDMIQLAEMELWPVYGDDGYAQRWAETDVPMLMLNGNADPQTPLEIASKTFEHFDGEQQYSFTVPYSPHGVTMNSYTEGHLNDVTETCGTDLMMQFIEDPTARPDDSCLENVIPIAFSGDDEVNKTLSQTYFGTEDLWD